MKIELMKKIYQSNLKSRAILVVHYLVFRANKEGNCFPSLKTIAKDCSISLNTVKRALDDLIKAGFVQKETRYLKSKNGGQSSNLYQLSMMEESEEKEESAQVSEISKQPKIEKVSFQSLVRQEKEKIIKKKSKKVETKEVKNKVKRIRIAHQTKKKKDLTTQQTRTEKVQVNAQTISTWAAPQPKGVPP